MAGLVKELDAQTFSATIATGVTLVDFWAPWCVPCRKQAPVLDVVAEGMGASAVVAKVNTDDHGDIAGQFNIHFIPTLIVFKDGKEVKRFSSVQDAETLTAALKAALN